MIGKLVSHYKVIEKLGGGGMGVVYKAEDTKLKRTVALKFLPPSFSLDDEAKQRFVHEAQAASSLQHNNLCTIHDIDKTKDGQLFICMEYYQGETLQKKIEKGPLKIDNAIEIAIQIAEGLVKAHEKEIIHRDIKPANLFITNDGVVKILDFGLAKVIGQTQLTQMGSTVGTVAYMSPEQTRGEKVDHRTDIWSLGVVLYEMITGQQPFKGDYEQAVIYSILNENPQPLTTDSDDLPPELFSIITKALSKVPKNRYQTIRDLLSDFKTYGFTDYEYKTHDRLKFLEKYYPQWKFFALGVFILIVIMFFYLNFPFGVDSRNFESLAVLPFENYTGNEELEYFVAGMHSSLIGDIGKISALRVISKTTTNAYKNIEKSIPEIASELDVDVVIETSVLSLGDSVHLQVKLIEAFPEEKQLWVQDFHEEKSQILNLYHKVTKQISEEINIMLTPQEENMLAETNPVNPDAYKAYLLGMYYLNQLTPEAKEKGIEYLHEAIRIDPEEAFAYAGLALGYLEIGHGPLASEDVRSKAEAAALQAIKLDPNMPEANSALAEVYLYFHWKFDLAEKYFLKALELNPNLALTHYHYSWALYLFGNIEEAIVEHKLAQKYDPLNPKHTAWLGKLYNNDGQYEEAIRAALESFELQKDYSVGYYVLGIAYLGLGRIDDAIEAHKKLAEHNPWWTWPLCLTYTKTGHIDKAEQLLHELETTKVTPWTAFSRARMYTALEKWDKAFEWLNYEPHHAFTAWAAISPGFESLHDDPRFKDFVKRLNLPK